MVRMPKVEYDGAFYLNPGPLKVPVDPWHYRWSTVTAYLGKSAPVKVDTQAILSQFGSQVGSARRAG